MVEGRVIVWKAAKSGGMALWSYVAETNQFIRNLDPTQQLWETYVFVELFVPTSARRVSTGDHDPRKQAKCRVNLAYVVAIMDKNGVHYNKARSYVFSGLLPTIPFIYEVGKWVKPHNFNDDPREVCGAGINVHTKQTHCLQWMT